MTRAALAAAVGLALCLAAPCLAAAAEAPAPATVTTQATARERLPNTVADVKIAAVSQNVPSVAALRTALAAAAPPLLDYLKGAGVERLQTDGIEVRPEYDQPASGRTPRITGYSGRLSIRFQVGADKLGTVLGEVLARGANTIDDTTLHPRQEEYDAARDRLAAAATRQALAQAKAVAEAAGRQPGPVRSITVGGAGPLPGRGFEAMPAPPAMALRMSAAAPVSTAAGDSEVTASVTVVTTLADP